MPYIKQEERAKYYEVLNQLPEMQTKGDLEYCIFKLMKLFMKKRKRCYTELHSTVYAATHCADEFRRRYLDLREDEARIENGDVDE